MVMTNKGRLVVFESAPKCGKTTLAKKLVDQLTICEPKRKVIAERGALSRSKFARKIAQENIHDLAYSTSFYWADILFHNMDVVIPAIANGDMVVHDRYDLSIVTYRETYGLDKDYILLDEYLKRKMIIVPDLTIYLKPDPEIAYERIRNAADSSLIDREFLHDPSRFLLMQERIYYHIIRLDRRYLTLDTGSYSQEECIAEILRQPIFK